MRFDGRLAQWDDQRGFGFIEPVQGGERVFVHVSAFAPGDRSADNRPREGDRVSFELTLDAQGRKQARRVSRPDAPGRAQPAGVPRVIRRRTEYRDDDGGGGFGRWVGMALMLALMVALGWKGTQWWAAYGNRQTGIVAPLSATDGPVSPSQPSTVAFRCDGRTMCSQMTSCAEATYFLQNCPGTKMDGNRDGVPCEQQWCTSPWAK
ncbi:MAG: cold shock domain-containing protein [Burkholderiales bacterium]|uniref:Cold shock domain-containing protein n=1 Tax=Ottowia pentelensis TaxID=511108 RepID=A0ABV6PPN2_9BURK|nr:cold shock domain-containing protein [Ottowia sp.]MBN9405629.1 cold shock domain-containing protein [Burkholderiales bacterium]MBS0403134.1 cold shock domain-containing protein [Pseudomonadota bacterium]MBS0412844.1 cold shock domain-containing protein [Pseudomonadota bacterium]